MSLIKASFAILLAASFSVSPATIPPDNTEDYPVISLEEVRNLASSQVAQETQTTSSGVTPLSKQSSTRSALPMVRITSPAMCTGQTDSPHKSGNMASVHGRIKCVRPVTYLKTVTTLYKERWHGMQYLASDASSTRGKKTSEDAHPHRLCGGSGTFTYWGYSAHFTEEGGKKCYAKTANGGANRLSRFTC